MENEQRRIVIPQVGQDDFVETLLMTHTEAWQFVASQQPELAREIEQQANSLRVLLDDDLISSLEAARTLINTAVFAIEAMTLAIQKKNAALIQMDKHHTDPPQAA